MLDEYVCAVCALVFVIEYQVFVIEYVYVYWVLYKFMFRIMISFCTENNDFG